MAKPRKPPEFPSGKHHDASALHAAAADHNLIRQNASACHIEAGVQLISDLATALSPTKAEIALLRAFLADEIDAILLDGD